MDKVDTRLSVYFAVLACLCGLTFVGSPEVAELPAIAIFFALFGLVFVDLLGWFSLPGGFAYLALAAISVYAISAFVYDASDSAEPKMVAVSTLLVMVQSVLMLQRKNVRIFQQLSVFALLQLIVAAIFNNAVTYGFLLIPIGICAAGGLLYLHVGTLNRSSFAKQQSGRALVTVASSSSQASFVSAVPKLGQTCLLLLLPPMMLIGFTFFYGLPRTSDRARHGLGGAPLVGFSDQVSLSQIGQMLSNPAIAARITVKDRRTKQPYTVIDDFYLRGAVLENYDPTRSGDGSWNAMVAEGAMQPRNLPPLSAFIGERERVRFDEVIVDIDLSPMGGNSLFSVPPYFYDASGTDVVHLPDRWLIARREGPFLRRGSEISYRFLSRGFTDGNLPKFLPRFQVEDQLDSEHQSLIDGAKDSRGIVDSEKLIKLADQRIIQIEKQIDEIVTSLSADVPDEANRDPIRYRLEQERERLRQWISHEQAAISYTQACLDYDIDRIPSASLLAQNVVDAMKGDRQDPIRVARACESFLATSERFDYTLNLTNETLPGMDPIEQFLAVDLKGNCQFFASALVMMLRSQGIPARLVVGFNTDEYNSVGGYYVARQLHAHAWVEALVDAPWVAPGDQYYSDPEPLQYWMRLDPTPGGGGTDLFSAGRVEGVFDMVQQKWTRYVVDADAGDRRAGMSISSRDVSNSYQLYYEWLKLKISRIRAGELGAGAFADRSVFSWPIALATAVLLVGSMVVVSITRMRLSKRQQSEAAELDRVEQPSIAYFAEALRLLELLGYKRRRTQTAQEFTNLAALQLDQASAGELRQTEPSSQPPRSSSSTALVSAALNPSLNQGLASSLSELTTTFYEDRFGGPVPDGSLRDAEPITSGQHHVKIQAALDRIRAKVEQARGELPGGSAAGLNQA